MSDQTKIPLFTKANGFKILVFYLAFHVIFYLLSVLFSTTFMQLFTIKEMGSADFTFNDLYYRVVASENFEKDRSFRNEKSVVLINTGSLNKEHFRLELARLLLRLEDYQPAVLAVDHEFINDASKIGTVELKEAVDYFGNIIFADDPLAQNMLNLGEKGLVVFPMQSSIRYYKSTDETFAFKIAQRLSSKVKPLSNKLDSFPIHYCSYGSGISNWEDEINSLYDINFKAVEGLTFANPDSSTFEKLKRLIKGKAVILGNLGSGRMDYEFDIEDRFRVPVDPLAVYERERIMAGSVIHANVIENFLHPEEIFWDFKGFWFIFWQQFSYLFFLGIILFTTISKVVKKIFLGIFSIVSLFFIIQLMYLGIYISMGMTLLQLLVIEEVTLILQPYYEKFETYFKVEHQETNTETIPETDTEIITETNIETNNEIIAETNTEINNEVINKTNTEINDEANDELT